MKKKRKSFFLDTNGQLDSIVLAISFLSLVSITVLVIGLFEEYAFIEMYKASGLNAVEADMLRGLSTYPNSLSLILFGFSTLGIILFISVFYYVHKRCFQ